MPAARDQQTEAVGFEALVERLDYTARVWIGTTELQKKVAAKTGHTHRGIRDHINALQARALLLRRGPGNRPEYPSAGIV